MYIMSSMMSNMRLFLAPWSDPRTFGSVALRGGGGAGACPLAETLAHPPLDPQMKLHFVQRSMGAAILSPSYLPAHP